MRLLRARTEATVLPQDPVCLQRERELVVFQSKNRVRIQYEGLGGILRGFSTEKPWNMHARSAKGSPVPIPVPGLSVNLAEERSKP